MEQINLPNINSNIYILRQEGSIFYLAASDSNTFKFFRVNINDKSFVEYSNQTNIPIFYYNGFTNYGKFNFMHNGKFYQNYNGFLLEFDDTNNTVNNYLYYNPSVYPIKINNYLIDNEKITNLDNNQTLPITIQGQTYFLDQFRVYNGNVYAFASTYQGAYSKVVKIDGNSASLSVVKEAIAGYNFFPLQSNMNYQQQMAGSYLVFGETNQSTLDNKLVSLNLDNTSEYNNLMPISNNVLSNMRYFNIGNNLYIQMGETNSTIYTNGISVNNINIPLFNSEALVFPEYAFNSGYAGNCFFKYNNKLIGLNRIQTPNTNSYVYNLYETDGTNSGTLLKNVSNFNDANFIHPAGLRIYNSEAYFFNYYSNVYKYDGTNYYKLYDFSNYGTATSEAFYHNNYMLFCTYGGLYRLNLTQVTPELITLSSSTLSTQENQKPTLKLYPNPTKSTLNFSEELTDIKIIDMGGKQVSATQSKTKTISVENLPKGNYLITGKNKNDKTISEKFIKQ